MRFWLTTMLTAALAASACAAQEQVHLLSYEAIPSAQMALDMEAATYAQRAELTAAVRDALSPQIFVAVGVDPGDVETDLTPGGFLLRTNASLQARGTFSEVEAVRLAAALGYVYRQWSVLVSRLDDELGDTGYVVVGFPEDALTPERAQAFFEAAAAVEPGLGGGYTAFGDEMIFLNVRDAEHRPYSDLEDMMFAAGLGEAAGRFAEAPVRVVGAGHAAALFVGNDWDASPEGQDYAAALNDPELVAELDALRAVHSALVADFATRFGWLPRP